MSEAAALPVDPQADVPEQREAAARPGDVVLALDVGASHFQAGLVTPRGVLIDRASAAIEADVFEVLSLEGSVSARDHIGGTAPRQVAQAAVAARARLAARRAP